MCVIRIRLVFDSSQLKSFSIWPILCYKLTNMKKNIGPVDTVIRSLVALVILILYFWHMISGRLAIVLLVVAGIFLLTSFMGVSPLYKLFGLDTCETKEE